MSGSNRSNHRRRVHAALIAALTIATAWSCGGSTPVTPRPPQPPPPPPSNDLRFIADGGSPADAVALTLQSTSETQIVLALFVNNVADLYGAGVDLTFDPEIVGLASFEEGSMLNVDGTTTNVQVTQPQAGTIVIGASRVGAVPGVTGSGTLVLLWFDAVTAGSTAIATSNGAAFDSTGAALTLEFFGGTITVPGG